MPLPPYFFVKTTAIEGAPTDTLAGVAPGRDPGGYALVNASFVFSTRTLTALAQTPFTNTQIGDYIYLLNAAGGVVEGGYEVESVTSTSVIVLVADSGLTADSTGDVDSSDGPWETIQFGLDNTLDTNILSIAADGNGAGGRWEPAATLDFDTVTTPNSTAGLGYVGANGRGVPDGTQVEISGTAHSGPTASVAAGYTENNINVRDLRFTEGTGSCFNLDPGSVSLNNWTFIRCRFDNGTVDGLVYRGTSCAFLDCEADHNAGIGFNLSSGSSSGRATGTMLSRCRAHHNGLSGYNASGNSIRVAGSLAYRNGEFGFNLQRDCGNLVVDDCTFFLNVLDGIGADQAVSSNTNNLARVTNSVFKSNRYGVNLNNWAVNFIEIDYCCFFNNSSGTVGPGTVRFLGSHPGVDNNIYVDPLFESEVDNAEDFTPADGSPLIDLGIQVPVR